MKISILDDYQNVLRTLPSFAKIAGHDVTIWNDHTKDVTLLSRRLAECEALVLLRERTPITADLLKRLPKLRLISQSGYYPHIDVDACTRNGVMLCSRKHTGSSEPSWGTTELTWALVLMGLRDLPLQIDSMKAGKWQSGIGRAARGRILGIYAYGRLGSVVAGYGRAFGMKVLVWGRGASMERARRDGYSVARNRAAFFGECDVISLHLPLVEETKGIVKKEDLLLMKKSALLVNTSRAGLIEPGALLDGLRLGRPGRAALDVYDEEPLLDDTHPLLNMPNVICTPHIGYVEYDGYEKTFGRIFDQIVAFSEGRPINVVNPSAHT